MIKSWVNYSHQKQFLVFSKNESYLWISLNVWTPVAPSVTPNDGVNIASQSDNDPLKLCLDPLNGSSNPSYAIGEGRETDAFDEFPPKLLSNGESSGVATWSLKVGNDSLFWWNCLCGCCWLCWCCCCCWYCDVTIELRLKLSMLLLQLLLLLLRLEGRPRLKL